MTTKEWLNRGRDLDKEINALEQAKHEAYCSCTSTTNKLKDDTIKSDKNPNANLERLAELNHQIDAKVDELTEIKREIMRVVLKVEDEACRTLLAERYVYMKTWEQIAEILAAESSTVRGRLHNTAIYLCATYCGIKNEA